MGDAVEGRLEVTRTARYWVLGDAVEEPGELWYVLHGYRQLAERFLRRFTGLDDGRRRVVAPEGLSRFYTGSERGRHGAGSVVGATWMTREDREYEIRDYVAYLDALDRAQRAALQGPLPEVTVLGFSQGVATAARWTALGSVRPRRLVLWGDFIPPDLDLARAREAWAETDVVLVRGSDDPVLRDTRLAEAEARRLEAAGLAPRIVSYEDGHDIHQPTLLALAGAVGDRGGAP